MFIHAVIFEIEPKEIKDYRKDSKMWAGYAKKAKGFITYYTMKRFGYNHQYASIYEWKAKIDHDRFMDEHHDWLVSKSKARVKVLGYYNLKDIDRVK
jgi:hypothetical protein